MLDVLNTVPSYQYGLVPSWSRIRVEYMASSF